LFRQFRHAYLLVALVLILAVHPFVAGLPVASFLFDVFFFLTIVAAVVSCAPSRRQAIVGIVLGSALQILVFVDAFLEVRLFGARAILGVLFFGYVFVLLMHQILRERRVTADTLYGGVSGYLLLGTIWAFAYAALELFVPGSFTLGIEMTDLRQGFLRFVGYSFVTLTTLGYGNIVPANPRADALANLEAIVGQVYVTVLIARLVAMNLTQSGRPESSGS
jgi:voltage-gated potassium channel